MLLMKQAQVEQTLRDELSRLRYIESRIQQIDTDGALQHYDIVMKDVPPGNMLALREVCPSFPEGRKLALEMLKTLPAKVGKKNLGHMMAVVHSELFEFEDIDMELGFAVAEEYRDSVTLPSGLTMAVRELPPVETMLTVTRIGTLELGHGYYAALGVWMDAHGYQFDGPVREIFIKPSLPGQEAEAVTEVQFPVKKVDRHLSLASLS
jgi:effector-binding domain-containing protein